MAWIIGTIVILFAVLYWRVSWLLGILVVIVVGSLAWYGHYVNEKNAREQEIATAALKQKIAKALENASPDGKDWHIKYELDPSSGMDVARNASIISNDGLCRLVVEKRFDGSDRTGLHCPDFKNYEDKDMEIKFDDAASSDKIDIGKFTNESGVYISPFLFVSPLYIDYKEFMNRLKVGKTLAIKIPAEEGVWVNFNLEGGAEAVNKLGRVQVINRR